MAGTSGTPWTPRGNPGGEKWGIACSESRMVAVGWGVLASNDGLSWDSVPVPPEWRLRKVSWGRSLFVAVGSTVPGPGRRIVATSPDGVSWTERSVPNFCRDVASSGDLFVAVGYDSIQMSQDGTTWSDDNVSLPGKVSGLRGVTWGGSLFVAVGTVVGQEGDRVSARALILTSSDGMTWTERSAPGSGLDDVAWSGERFVAVGTSILTSEDGTAWTEQRAPVERFFLADVAWGGTQFAAVGTVPDARGNIGLFMTSPDGVTWARNPAPSRRIEPKAVAWCGTRFVAAGFRRQGWFADYTRGLILTSP